MRVNGTCRSGGRAGFLSSTRPPTTTNRAAASRPASKPGSRRSAQTRVRYGYRRVHVLLRREGWEINVKKTRRIYNELGLQLRNKTPKRRVKAKLRDDRCEATRPNEIWAMDFVHDQLATGKKIRVLTVVDTFSRFSPVIDPRFSYRAEDVVQTLERVCAAIGYPKTIRVDQGSEFVSRDLDLWAYAQGRHAGLLTAGQADGQRLHRGLQRALPGGVPERALVPDACRRAAKSWRLGADTTTRIARTGRSATRRRSRCMIPMALPARHRDEPENSNFRRSKQWSRTTGNGHQRTFTTGAYLSGDSTVERSATIRMSGRRAGVGRA